MIKKLLKYDLKWIYKPLLTFYTFALILSVFTKIFTPLSNSMFFGIITYSLVMITTILLVGILLYTIIRLWSRFNSNLYGDESYLTYTLPVKKKKIYISKVLTAIITLNSSILIIFISRCITNTNLISFLGNNNLLYTLRTIYNANSFIIILIMFMEIFVLSLLITLIGYFSIMTINKYGSNKSYEYFVLGISLLFWTLILMIPYTFIISIFDTYRMDNAIPDANGIVYGICPGIYSLLLLLYYVGATIFYYFFSKKKFNTIIDIN